MRAWLGCGRKGPSPVFLGVRRGAHHLLPVATAQPLSTSAFFAAAAFTSSGRTCGAAGSLSATLSGSFTPGTEGRTKPCAKMPWPMSLMMKLSQSLPALGLGPFSTRLIAYGAAADARRARIEVDDRVLVFGLEQIRPRLRHVLDELGVDDEGHRQRVNREPFALGIAEHGRELVEIHRLERGDDVLGNGVDGRRREI